MDADSSESSSSVSVEGSEEETPEVDPELEGEQEDTSRKREGPMGIDDADVRLCSNCRSELYLGLLVCLECGQDLGLKYLTEGQKAAVIGGAVRELSELGIQHGDLKLKGETRRIPGRTQAGYDREQMNKANKKALKRG